jgi:hypothetical protein
VNGAITVSAVDGTMAPNAVAERTTEGTVLRSTLATDGGATATVLDEADTEGMSAAARTVAPTTAAPTPKETHRARLMIMQSSPVARCGPRGGRQAAV